MLDEDATSLQLVEEGTTLRRFFFRNSSLENSPLKVVSWWESRRLAYNAAVGVTGVISFIIANAFMLLGPGGEFFGPPLPLIILYGVFANIFYSGGWIAELMLRPVFGVRTPVVGSALFRYGFAFSIGLTLLPTVGSVVDFVFRMVKGVFL